MSLVASACISLRSLGCTRFDLFPQPKNHVLSCASRKNCFFHGSNNERTVYAARRPDCSTFHRTPRPNLCRARQLRRQIEQTIAGIPNEEYHDHVQDWQG